MTRLVFDASVLVKLLMREPASEEALALYEASEAIVPDWAYIECCHGLWKKQQRGGIDADQLRESLSALVLLNLDAHESLPLLEHATELAILLNHPVYDCLYLALAVAEECAVVTCDAKLVGAAREAELGGRVKLLGTP